MKKKLNRLFLDFIILVSVFSLTGCHSNQNICKPSISENSLPDTEESLSDVTTTDSETTAMTTSFDESDSPYTEIQNPQYIHSDIVNRVKAVLQKNAENSSFASYKTGKVLQVKDLNQYKFSSDDTDSLNTIRSNDEQMGEPSIDLVDIDNDGTNELTISQYQGGTAGFVQFYVFKKNSKGEYCKMDDTGELFTFCNALSIIRYGNMNYLLSKNDDYSKKTFYGFSIYSFRDGKIAETADVNLYTGDNYTTKIDLKNEQYGDYLKSIDIKNIIGVTENGNVKTGTAESQTDETAYKADFNNDGQNENYEKDYRLTTNGYPSWLIMNMKTGDSEFDNDPIEAITGMNFDDGSAFKILEQFWCDNYQNHNITNVLYRNDRDPGYTLNVYLMNGKKSALVGSITATPVKNIGLEYYAVSSYGK